MRITNNGPQNIGQIKKHVEHSNLFLSPEEYQPETAWNLDQKKLLVDTMFRDLDIPKFYLWKIDFRTLVSGGYPEGETNNFYRKRLEQKRRDNDDAEPHLFEVVDGQQRIRTLLEFMGVRPKDSAFRGRWLQPFSSLSEIPMAKGKTFRQLNVEQQTKFEEKTPDRDGA